MTAVSTATYGAVVRPDWASDVQRDWHPFNRARVYVVPESLVKPPAGSSPIMLLHGIGNSGAIYAPIMASLARLGPVAAPTMSPDLLKVDVEDRAGVVADLVDWLSVVSPPPWRVVGHSMGGVLLGMILRTHPDVVSSAVLLNSPLPSTVARIQGGNTLDRGGRALLALRGLAGVSSFGRPRLPGFLRGPELALVRTALGGFVHEPGELDDEVVSKAIISSRTTDGGQFLRLAEQLPAWESEPFVECPVEIVLGDSDPLIELSDHDALRAAYPAANLHVIEPCGHFAHIEQPHRTIDLIERAFARG